MAQETEWVTAIVYGKTVSWPTILPATTKSHKPPKSTNNDRSPTPVPAVTTSKTRKHKTSTSDTGAAITTSTSDPTSSGLVVVAPPISSSQIAISTRSSPAAAASTSAPSSTILAASITSSKSSATTPTENPPSSSTSSTTNSIAGALSTAAVTTNAKASNSHALAIGLGVGIPVFVILCGLLFGICFIRRKKQKQVRDSFQFLDKSDGSAPSSQGEKLVPASDVISPSEMSEMRQSQFYQPNREPTLPVLPVGLVHELHGDEKEIEPTFGKTVPHGINPFISPGEDSHHISKESADAFDLNPQDHNQQSRPWLPPVLIPKRASNSVGTGYSLYPSEDGRPGSSGTRNIIRSPPASPRIQEHPVSTPTITENGVANFSIPRRPVPGA